VAAIEDPVGNGDTVTGSATSGVESRPYGISNRQILDLEATILDITERRWIPEYGDPVECASSLRFI
jgi:hypothetical protein